MDIKSEEDINTLLIAAMDRLDPDLRNALVPLFLSKNFKESAEMFTAICEEQANRLRKKDI